jgi:translation initiation factor 6 (eIF-6)
MTARRRKKLRENITRKLGVACSLLRIRQSKILGAVFALKYQGEIVSFACSQVFIDCLRGDVATAIAEELKRRHPAMKFKTLRP